MALATVHFIYNVFSSLIELVGEINETKSTHSGLLLEARIRVPAPAIFEHNTHLCHQGIIMANQKNVRGTHLSRILCPCISSLNKTDDISPFIINLYTGNLCIIINTYKFKDEHVFSIIIIPFPLPVILCHFFNTRVLVSFFLKEQYCCG